MEYFGIDVGHDQGKIDWAQVKKSGVGFAILRCHQRFGTDLQFKRNYSQCQKKGIPVGAYKYSYAQTVEDAKKEAEIVLSVLKGKTLQFPVFYDLEWDTQKHYSLEKIEAIAEAFLSKIEAAGFKVGIYCYLDWYKNLISDNLKKKYDFWIASYPFEDTGIPKDYIRPLIGVGWQYSERGRIPGISGYVCLDLFNKNYAANDPKDLEEAKEKPEEAKPLKEEYVIDRGTSADDIIQIARGWLGRNERDGSHREIIDLYNAHKPLARGYAVQYTDSWCDTFVSACFIKAGAVDLIGGTECGCEEHVKIFKTKGIWEENGRITPNPGDIIVFNWDASAQPNDGFSDHIGIVEEVQYGFIHTIEGNSGGAVARRSYSVGHHNIRGFARPKYEENASTTLISDAVYSSLEDIAREVIQGLWGNGADRVSRLKSAGYDPDAVQALVNELLR